MNKMTLLLVLTLYLMNQNLYCSDKKLEDDEIYEFVRSYFTAARTYDKTRMISLLSRDVIEHALSNIVISDSDLIMKRNVKLALNEYFSWPYCLIHILDIKENLNGYEIRLGFEKRIDSPGTGVEYIFNLTYENNKFRLKNFMYTDKKINKFNRDPDIDLCSIPIPAYHVSFLLPDETLEEQRKRLDIPDWE